ncbi:MAG TPA: hypothetical protein VJT33_00435 [bacterium]|nr:hypothetical protein [bacterium]
MRRVGFLRALLVGLLAWLVVGTVRTYPSYLAYFNELIGGPGNGYKYLSLADLDWGQGLKDLSTYLRRNGITSVKLAYFGTDNPRRFGITYVRLLPGRPATGDLAVSVTSLVGTHAGCETAFTWLQKYEPRAKIDYSIFVYHIPPTATLPPATPLPDCK